MVIRDEDIAKMGTRIAVEIGVPIKLELDGIELPLQSVIIGLEPDRYIIIKAPEPFKRVEHKFFKGADLIVRYISQGTVYAFQTKLMESITKPLALLFIEYPRIIQHHELRKRRRLSCHIPARVILGEMENIGCILDLAVTGCRCLIQASKNPEFIRCDLDKEITLKCIFPGSKEMTTLHGSIRNIKRTRKEIDMGIIFDAELPNDSKKVLAWFLSAIDGIPFI